MYKLKKSCGKKTNKLDNQVTNSDLVTIGEFLKEIDSSQLDRKLNSKSSPRRALSNIFSEAANSLDNSSLDSGALANTSVLSNSGICPFRFK